MPYKAKEDIGNYKVGEVVSDEDAKIWEEMYTVSPVEYFELDEKTSVPETKHNASKSKAKVPVSKGKVK
jgi:hypothetical protein